LGRIISTLSKGRERARARNDVGKRYASSRGGGCRVDDDDATTTLDRHDVDELAAGRRGRSSALDVYEMKIDHSKRRAREKHSIGVPM
jgi:hypothetical protein